MLKRPRKNTFISLDYYPYPFGSKPSRLYKTFLGSDPCGVPFESNPERVRIADPNGIRSIRSRVNASPSRSARIRSRVNGIVVSVKNTACSGNQNCFAFECFLITSKQQMRQEVYSGYGSMPKHFKTRMHCFEKFEWSHITFLQSKQLSSNAEQFSTACEETLHTRVSVSQQRHSLQIFRGERMFVVTTSFGSSKCNYNTLRFMSESNPS